MNQRDVNKVTLQRTNNVQQWNAQASGVLITSRSLLVLGSTRVTVAAHINQTAGLADYFFQVQVRERDSSNFLLYDSFYLLPSAEGVETITGCATYDMAVIAVRVTCIGLVPIAPGPGSSTFDLTIRVHGLG